MFFLQVDNMKKVELDLFGLNKSAKVFDEGGDGLNFYKFLQAYQTKNGSMLYKEVRTSGDSKLPKCAL